MNLNQFKEYIDKNKALTVSEELKEKTISVALNSNIEPKQSKINFLKAKNINRFIAIAACFAVTVGVLLFAGLHGRSRIPSEDTVVSEISSPSSTVTNIQEETSATNNETGLTQNEIGLDVTKPNATNKDAAKSTMKSNMGQATQKNSINKPVGNSRVGQFIENPFIKTSDNPISTFSIDVDTASYVIFRRDIARMSLKTFQDSGNLIRTEEAINYFKYNYTKPTGDVPIAVTTAVGNCSWNPEAKLAIITMAGKDLNQAEQKGSNIVFLIDVSGSMQSDDKLPLLKKSLIHAIENLNDKDTVSIVTYASGVCTVLSGAKGSEKSRIINAVNQLQASGGTAGADGLTRAYSVAQDYFIKGGNNRILLATDGDFNIGPSSVEEMKKLVTQNRESGIFLTVLGFGVNNYSFGDQRLEVLADNGNGGYYVIDNLNEGEKVLNQQFSSVLYTVAKDVKIQVEFNKSSVESYRLIGYENRLLSSKDFDNDKVDAGDLGSGQTVTALYEIILKDNDSKNPFNVKVRYKNPDSDKSLLYQHDAKINENLTDDFYFASAVAEACLVINNSQYKGTASLKHAYEMAYEFGGNSSDKSRLEFIQILKKLIS
jgi:Ca-activated chloride channel family protein